MEQQEASAVESERQTAALSYVLIPLAFSVLFDIGREPRSVWARTHAKRALIFGTSSALILFVVAAIPLVVLGLTHLGNDAILRIYGVSFVVDLACLCAVMAYALRAARRAARGEL